jgi:AcrR family transcriptional regulator
MRVLEALLALVEEGELRPTAQEVAARAGVALRTVYHHFEDVQALRSMALSLQMNRHLENLQPIDPKLPIDERVQILTRQYRRLFEQITPIRRAAMFDEHASHDMAEGIRRMRAIRREHVAAAFAPELARRAEEGRVLLDAIDVATSWDTWNYLRAGLARSAGATEKILMRMLIDLFAPRRGGRTGR